MVTPTEKLIWIKDHLKVTTKPIYESLYSQELVVDDLSGLNDDVHKAAYYTAINPGGCNKGINVSSIMEAILAIDIHAANYFEDTGRSMDPNVMEWSWIKHIKSIIQIQYNWINPDPLP